MTITGRVRYSGSDKCAYSTAVLDGRYPGHYIIYNLSGRQYHASKFSARVVEGAWSSKKAATLGALYNLALSVYDFLSRDPKNVAVIHCMVSLVLKKIILFSGALTVLYVCHIFH